MNKIISIIIIIILAMPHEGFCLRPMAMKNNNIAIGTLDYKRDIVPENKIGEGSFREVYRFGGFAVKVLKPYREKKYGFITIKYPIHLYTRFKYLAADFNKLECVNYQEVISKIPEGLRDSFAKVFGIRKGLLFSELIVDANGAVSQTLSQHGVVDDKRFWQRFDQLGKMMLDADIYFIYINPDSMVVKILENGEAIPVLFDYKRIGYRTCPVQLDLIFKHRLRAKVKRRFERLRKLYMPRYVKGIGPDTPYVNFEVISNIQGAA